MLGLLPIFVALAILAQGSTYHLAACGPQVCAAFEDIQETFSSMCALLAEIEATGKDWHFQSLSECPIQGCTREYDPVCGVADNNFRTFPNECVMRQESQTTGVLWTQFFPGECEALTSTFNSPGMPTIGDAYNDGRPNEGAISRIRYHNNLNNTFHGPYVEGNYYNAATHNYYGFILPHPPFTTALDLWSQEDNIPEQMEECGDEETNTQSKPVVIGGTTFPSVLGALKHLCRLTQDLLIYIRGAKEI